VRFSKELRVALLALVACTFLYFGYRFLRGTDFFSSTRTYYAEYPNVEGLAVSSPVMDQGVKVGIVKNVELKQDRANSVRVTIEVDKKLELGDSTVAVLASSSLLGGKMIDLNIGNSRVKFEGGETLRSYAPQSLTDLFASKAQPLIARVDSTLIKFNETFNVDAKKSIQATLANSEATTAALRQLLVQNQANIAEITANMASLTTSFKGTARKLDRLSNNLALLSDSLKDVNFAKVVRELDSTATAAHKLVAQLNSKNGSLGKLMYDDSLYTNLNKSSADLDRLLVDFKENPKRYVSFSVFSKSRVNEATSVTGNDKVIVKKAGAVEVKTPMKK
jgi:phospholipid/cholesterol/gamma-HCH transport system substrate-binding protein